LHFEDVPHPWDLHIVNCEAKFIMNQTYLDHKVYEWEGSYAYSSIVRGFLHLQVGIISFPSLTSRHNIPPNSRREIDGYKVPSTYTTIFFQVLYMKLVFCFCLSRSAYVLGSPNILSQDDFFCLISLPLLSLLIGKVFFARCISPGQK